MLLEPQDHLTLEGLKARAPQGAKVLEEQWYSLERPARPWGKRSAALKKPRVRAGHTLTWSVTVVLDDSTRRRVPDALVTVMTDEDKGIGVEATTSRHGKAGFVLSDKTQRLDAIYVDPLHSAWPMRVGDVLVVPGGIEIAVVPINLAAADARGTVYGKPAAGTGKTVRVAVVDTGVGPHSALKVRRGLNTTAAESGQRFRDEDGLGSQVAGVIASAAAGWRHGEAGAAELLAYRIFESGDPYASSFAIATAIKDAANQGCDLVNLSIGDSMADAGIRDAVEFAWARGCVCVAATGNDGKGQVDYPARYPQAIAVSAIGLVGSWPAGAYLDWTLSTSRGKLLGGQPSFLAGFSNHGAKVALTAPGVGVVSTIFGSRWGVVGHLDGHAHRHRRAGPATGSHAKREGFATKRGSLGGHRRHGHARRRRSPFARRYARQRLGPIIQRMCRYVFSNNEAQDDKVLTAAKKAARSRGATVVKSLAGTMLLELAPAQVSEVAEALPGWRYAVERKTTRVPERRPLERAKARGAVAIAAKG